jgi:hypothetical protein
VRRFVGRELPGVLGGQIPELLRQGLHSAAHRLSTAGVSTQASMLKTAHRCARRGRAGEPHGRDLPKGPSAPAP